MVNLTPNFLKDFVKESYLEQLLISKPKMAPLSLLFSLSTQNQ